MLDDLDRHVGLTGQPTEVRITRWWRSMPQYAPGHGERIDRLEAMVARAAPGLQLAGAAYRGLGVPACIAQGQAAARRGTGHHRSTPVVTAVAPRPARAAAAGHRPRGTS